MSAARRHRLVTRALLRRMPLPGLPDDGDKETRGRVLVIGGSMLTPGAILLAGIAALRAGAGKLQLGTVQGAAMHLGLAVPESLVLGLPTRNGEIAGARAASVLRQHAARADAVLVGPGMAVGRSVNGLLSGLVSGLGPDALLILDGAAVIGLRDNATLLGELPGRVVLTPHAGEVASLMGIERHVVEQNAPAIAQHMAKLFGATVVLKGAQSWIAEPGGALFCFTGGSVGLGTSGSGDTLAGIVAGLAATGATACTAALWGVWAHAASGAVLSKRMGQVGFLARELLANVPALLCSERVR